LVDGYDYLKTSSLHETTRGGRGTIADAALSEQTTVYLRLLLPYWSNISTFPGVVQKMAKEEGVNALKHQ
jgi:hypothetical protein